MAARSTVNVSREINYKVGLNTANVVTELAWFWIY